MKVSFRDMDIFSTNEEDKDIFFFFLFFYKNRGEMRDWGYETSPWWPPCKVLVT